MQIPEISENTQTLSHELRSRIETLDALLQDQDGFDRVRDFFVAGCETYMHEATGRGQTLVLRCFLRFVGEADSSDLHRASRVPQSLLISYAMLPNCMETLSAILDSLESRGLSRVSGDSLVELIKKACGEIVESIAKPGTTKASLSSSVGPVSRVLIGYLNISRDLIRRVPSFLDRLSLLNTDMARVINVTAFDRRLREACYATLAITVKHISDIPALGLQPAQARELRIRMCPKLTHSISSSTETLTTTTISTPSVLSQPSRSPGVKDWTTRYKQCSKWQEKRDLLLSLKSASNSLSQDFLSEFPQLFKDEANAPIIVAMLDVVKNCFAASDLDIKWCRKLVFITLTKLRLKNPTVNRSISSTITTILSHRGNLFDQLFGQKLAEIAKFSRKEILQLLEQIREFIPSLSEKISLVEHVLSPAIETGDTVTREMSIHLMKQLLADVASRYPEELGKFILAIENGATNLSDHRKRAFREALGIHASAEQGNSSIGPHPSANDMQHTVDVSLLIQALVNGQSLVDGSAKIESSLPTCGKDPRLMEVVTKSLKAVVLGDDEDSRIAVLSMLHSLTRFESFWFNASLKDVQLFTHELLMIIDDKDLRQRIPNVWNEINLCLVHALANSQRSIGFAVLIEVWIQDGSSTLRGLVLKCIDKLNKALLEYTKVVGEAQSQSLIWSILDAVIGYTVKQPVCEPVRLCLVGTCRASTPLDLGEYIGSKIADREHRAIFKALIRDILGGP